MSADKSDYKVEMLPEDYPRYDLSFKLIVIGDSGVGKSCLANKATKNTFEPSYLATVGFEFFSFNVKINEKVVKLQIWDTCGQEIYRSLITNFYRNSSLAVIVYAINDFQDIEMWLKDLKTYSNPDVKIFLIGNKSDLEESRLVKQEEALAFKENFQLNYFAETSAKTGLNAQELFIEAARVLYDDYVKYNKNLNTSESMDPQYQNLIGAVGIEEDEFQQKKKCC